MTRNYYLITLTLAVLLITGCGPVYNTTYRLTPPKSASGRSCILNCSTIQSQCEHLERIEADRCEDRSRWEQRECERDFERRGEKPKWYDCVADSCTPELERCEEQYRRCYESCGGEVHAETVCVSGCDKIGKR